MIKLLVASLLSAAAVIPAAWAQETSVRDVMRARMQARVDAQGGRGPGSDARPDRPQRTEWQRGRADNGDDRRGRDDERGRAGRDGPQGQADGRWQRPDRPELIGGGQLARPDRPDPVAGWRRDRDERASEGQPGRRPRVDADRTWRSERNDVRRGDDRGWNRPDQRSQSWRGRGDDRGRWSDDRGRWSSDWRREPRYDWDRYRSTNRSAYRLPRYYAPYGWNSGYRRFSTGARLSGVLYERSYWIDDPWSYRLPDAYGPYRWIRYYDDALLVDLDSGEAVDVIHGIFW